MKQIKALIKKEWWTHWATMMLPSWFTLGVIVTFLIGLIWALIQGADLNFFVNMKSFGNEYDKIVLWGLGLAGPAMLAFLAMLTGTGMADTMLNSGFKKHCEIFHLSQPVSLPKIIGVKFGLITLGLYLQIVIISLLGVTAAGSYLAIKLGLSVAYAYTGMLQSLISMFFPFLFVVSFYWMFAGIFKNGSFMKSVAIVAGIEIARNILNKATGFHFSSLVSYLGKLAGLGSGVNISLADSKIGSLGNATADATINSVWSMLLDEFSLQRIAFSIIFFAAGYWFYSRREIS